MPYEFTCEGMLQRINAFIEKQVRLSLSASALAIPSLLVPQAAREYVKAHHDSVGLSRFGGFHELDGGFL